LELTPEIPVSQEAQIIVPDDSSVQGSDYLAVYRQVDPDNGLLQSEEPDPVSQEATSHSSLESPVDNDRRDFQAIAVVLLKKEQHGYIVLGILVALIIAVFRVLAGVLTGLKVAGFEISSIAGQLLGLVFGAATPLVRARGRNAAIGTVVFFTVMLVAMILVYYPQGATGIDIQVSGRPRSLLFKPQRYDIVLPSVVDSLAQQKEGTQAQSVLEKEETPVQYVHVGTLVCVIGVFCCVLSVWCTFGTLQGVPQMAVSTQQIKESLKELIVHVEKRLTASEYRVEKL